MVDPFGADTVVPNIARRDIGNLIVVHRRCSGLTVDLLQNIERDFLVGVDQRNNLELKCDLFELNIRLLRESGVDDATTVEEEMVLTGTGISVPDAMIAFLLLLVKTVGREIVRNRPVVSSALTIAASVFPAAT